MNTVSSVKLIIGI